MVIFQFATLNYQRVHHPNVSQWPNITIPSEWFGVQLLRQVVMSPPVSPAPYMWLAPEWVPFQLAQISHAIHNMLRDPLPAKHLEEQTDTKTYDLWCRKGGGTGWQDIKATDLWCRKGGGTGWQDIKASDLWCRKGGGTGWQDIKGTDLWCKKGGGKGWQGISAISGARGVAERDEGGWKLLIFGAWQVAEEGIRRASRLLIWGILRCRTGGRKEQQDIKPTAHEM